MASTTGVDPTASFSEDPHISFDKEIGKWRYENDDGSELEWDIQKCVWLPVVDDDLVKAQQAAYAVDGVDEEAPAAPVLKRTKKRKEVDYTSNTDPSAAGPSIKRGKISALNKDTGTNAKDGEPPKQPPSKNTAVFVGSLPLDTTVPELAARFGKFGVLMEDDYGQPKIKLYAREDGTFSGEALVVYFMEESVDLAVTMLDEAELRLGERDTIMNVKKGDFGHKSGGGVVSGGVGIVKGAGGGGERRVVDKKKATARINKMKSKLADWHSDSDSDSAPSSTNAKATSSWRSVLLKHMFTLDELEKDASLLLDLKDEVREECETLGQVTSVVLYDKEPDGVMTVKFKDAVSAQACVVKMHGRFFDGRQVQATLFDGKAKFRRSGVGVGEEDEQGAAEEEGKRLDAFAKWLEDGGEKESVG